MRNKYCLVLLIFLLLNFSNSYPNNLRISNYNLNGIDIYHFLQLKIDSISWENSWRVDIPGAGYSAPNNHDAIWLFAKYKKKNTTTWFPSKFMEFAINIPLNCEAKIPSDSMGIFLLRKNNGVGNIRFTNLQFYFLHNNTINYPDSIDFQIFAIEMVYIPQDSFYVGGATNSTVTGQFCANDNNSPYKITGENSIILGGLGVNSLNNHNAAGMASMDDFNNTAFKILPADFPKGYKSIYCMKYEITSQQYVDFLNCLADNQRKYRYAKAFGTDRNAIQFDGIKFFTNAPDRANNFMSWADGAAYTDWCGLRPMSELEMEKISRGPLNSVTDEFAWGNTTLVQITSMSGTDGSGTETALPQNSNCNYNLVDGAAGQPIGGPLRVGIFATPLSDRTLSGSSYYGVMDMSGNCWERPVTVGNDSGRVFNGQNGDGILDSNGNANVMFWPGVSSIGSGFRMGNWFRGTDRLRVNDRYYASTSIDSRTGHRSFRCVRYSN